MLALPFRDDVGNVHPVAVDCPDNRRRFSFLFGGIGNEGDLRSLHRKLAFIGLVQHRSRSHRCLGANMLPVVLERCDEAAVGSQRDVCFLELEPVLPAIL